MAIDSWGREIGDNHLTMRRRKAQQLDAEAAEAGMSTADYVRGLMDADETVGKEDKKKMRGGGYSISRGQISEGTGRSGYYIPRR